MRCLGRFALVLLILGLSGMCLAESDDRPVLNRFGHSGLVRIYSARPLGLSRLVFNLAANASSDNRYVTMVIQADTASFGPEGSQLYDTLYPAISLFEIYPSLAVGALGFADISAALPVYLDMMGSNPLQAGIGDVEAGFKLAIPQTHATQILFVAALGSMSFPTGDKSQGYFAHRAYYFDTDSSGDSGEVDYNLAGLFSSNKPELDMRILWTLDLEALGKHSAIRFHLNAGVRLNFNPRIDDVLILGGALEYEPVEWATLFAEYTQETRFVHVADGFKANLDPIRLSPGLSLKTPGGMILTMGADFALMSETVSSYRRDGRQVFSHIEPKWRLSGALGWSGITARLDSDRDGIADRDDDCPLEPEDIDGFEDSDGCPDPDNDKDGIPDKQDKCPNAAEDFDGFEDEDGCPDLDNDNDMVPDSIDQCPTVAEDFDGYEDYDGCPDFDNDRDGIPDSLDRCMIDPEDIDGFDDDDGCPDIDNDLDGIPDSLDRCPNAAGTIENSGCPGTPPPAPAESGKKNVEPPKPREIKRGRVILQGVDFEPGKPAIRGESYILLDQLFESLKEWPQIILEIRGHTNSLSKEAANIALSQKRAEVVREYLVMKGISPYRLQAVGKGAQEPLADKSSPEGRILKQRIEVYRID